MCVCMCVHRDEAIVATGHVTVSGRLQWPCGRKGESVGCHNNQVYRYSGTCNHPFIMIIIMIMSLAGVAVSRAALRPGRSASMPTSEGGELLVCLASIAFSNTEGEKRERGRER